MSSSRRTALSGRRLAVYLFLCAVWGSTWLVIKIGLRDLPPLRFAGFRMALACVLLAPAALSSRWRPSRREARVVALSGFLQIGVSYACIFAASQWIASGLAAILFASFPICVALFAHFLLPEEPLTRRVAASAAMGITGVAVIEAPAVAGLLAPAHGRLLAGGSLVFAAAVVSACANVLNKKFLSRVPPFVNVWGQTLVGSAVLLLAAASLEAGASARWTASAFASLAYLALFGTVLTFAGLFWLIPRVPVSVIGTIPLVDTLIAVLLGSLFLRERLSPRILAGGVLILAGVVLSSRPVSGFKFQVSRRATGLPPET
jgi:drug/metabolite transporter (DMT)-like permease